MTVFYQRREPAPPASSEGGPRTPPSICVPRRVCSIVKGVWSWTVWGVQHLVHAYNRKLSQRDTCCFSDQQAQLPTQYYGIETELPRRGRPFRDQHTASRWKQTYKQQGDVREAMAYTEKNKKNKQQKKRIDHTRSRETRT